MIVLRSKPTSTAGRIFWMVCAVLAGMTLLLQGALQFGEILRNWDELEVGDLVSASFQVLFGILSISLAAREFIDRLYNGDSRQCVVATANTLAIKTHGKPIQLIKRDDIVALSTEGRVFIRYDDTAYLITVANTHIMEQDAFLNQLYALWWPGLRRDDVKAYLKQIQPAHPAVGCVFFPLTFAATLLIPSVRLWDNIWIPIALLCVLFICILAMGWFMIRRQFRAHANWRYPLYDETDEFAEEAWEDLPLRE